MDRDEDYHTILSRLPLAEKYLVSCSPLEHSLHSMKKEREEYVGDVSAKPVSSPSSDDASSIDFENVPTYSATVPRAGHWGSAESGLNFLGRSRPSDKGQGHGVYERRSEERASSMDYAPSTPLSSAESKHRTKGSQSERKPSRPPIIPIWRPISTENILAKVKELLGDQAARAKVTGIVEAQKAAKRRPMEAKHNLPLKASHSSPVLCKQATRYKDMSLEAQISYNLQMKNRQNVPDYEDTKCDKSVRHNFKLGDYEKGCDLEDFRTDVQMEDSHLNKGLGSLSFGSTRSNDTVPTAHVTPNLLQSKSGVSPRHRSTSNLHRYPSDDTLHNRHGSNSDLRSAHISQERETQSGISHRWNSQNNLISDRNAGDFEALTADANMTVDPTAHYGDMEERDVYNRHKGVAVGLATRQTRYDMGAPHVRSGHSPVVHTEQIMATPREYQYSHPHRDVHRAGTPVGMDRAYQSGTQYNPHTYTQEYNYSALYPDSHSNTTPNVTNGDQFSSDLTSWQQKHQESLRRQQLEISQPVYGGQGSTTGYHSAPVSSVTSLLVGDPHKLDSVRRAADNIIKEKDMIIERQKMKIIDLERVTKETDRDMHKDMYRRAQDDNDMLNVKLQDIWDDGSEAEDCQYEMMSLKSTLAEYKTSNPKGSQGHLEQKLGASEHEVHELKMMLNKEMETKQENIKKLVEKLKDKDRLILEWQDKYTTLKLNHDMIQKKVDGMDRYFEDLPTADEHSQKNKQLESLRGETARCRDQLSDTEKKLNDAQKGVKSRDALIKSLEQNVQELQDKCTKLQATNAKLKERLSQDGIGFDDMEELQYENKKLRAESDSAKKLLQACHKKAQQGEARLKTELSEVKERLGQEESAIVALREEILSKDQLLKKLRQSFKETSSANQDLVERNMTLQDRMKETERHVSGDAHKLERRLIKEMSICFTELNNLVQICVQRAEGQDPNYSALLGVKGAAVGAEQETDAAENLQSLKCKVTKVREMRDEIDKLRELVSNKYAEDIGENLNGCATQ